MKRVLGMEIHKVDLLLKRNIDACDDIRRYDALTGTHGHILGYLQLHADEDIFQRDIEKRFAIRRSSASQILQLMERNGLIERHAVEKDARLKKIVVTPLGQAVHADIVHAIDALVEHAVRGISPQQLDTFYEVLDAIKHNLSEDAGLSDHND